jgi:hypothetical protein
MKEEKEAFPSLDDDLANEKQKEEKKTEVNEVKKGKKKGGKEKVQQITLGFI